MEPALARRGPPFLRLGEAAWKPLRDGLEAGRVVPVLGAGASTATAGLPGWIGLVESGLQHALEVGLASEAEVARAREHLDRGEAVDAARRVKAFLGAPAGEYPHWLERVCGTTAQDVRSRELIESVSDLVCPLVATTNYDRLLSQLLLEKPEPVTWRESVAMQAALKEGGRVLHLHGEFEDPASVVFGVDNYEELVRAEPYRAVLQALWLERSLLFIGCSFAGLEDPDFGKLLDWARRNFEGSPAKHFALIHESECTGETARDFLLQWRIQVLPYGPRYEDLPRALDEVNPNLDRAVRRRTDRIVEIARARTPETRGTLIEALHGMHRRGSTASMDLESVADALLQDQHETSDQLRKDVVAMQEIARGMVDPADLAREIGRWNRGEVKGYAGSFRSAVVASHSALKLFDDEVIRALKRRGVDIHLNWLSGTCTKYVNWLEEEKLTADAYTIENAKRVLTTLQAVLEVDPYRLFPKLTPGATFTQSVPERGVVVVRGGSLELRAWEEPRDVVAVLPLDPNLGAGGAVIERFRDRDVVIYSDSEAIYVWDPRRPTAPVERFGVSDAYGINGAAHWRSEGRLRSIVTTTGGPVFELEDLRQVREWRPGPGFLTQPVRLGEAGVFALVEGRLPVVSLDDTSRSLLGGAELRQAMLDRPEVESQVVTRLKEDEEYLASQASGFRPRVSFQHPHISTVDLGGEPALAVHVQVDFMTSTGTWIVFYAQVNGELRDVGHYYLDDTMVTDFDLASDDSGVLLVHACLSDFKTSYDLVGWARCASDERGRAFTLAGSTLRTYDDMMRVVYLGDGRGLASDASGGLFAFSIKDGSCAEIGRERESGIGRLLRWGTGTIRS